MTAAMLLGMPREMLWAGVAGAAILAASFAAPLVTRWRMRRHALQVEARDRRGHDLYHEERRALEAWPPAGRVEFDAETVVRSLVAAAFATLAVYALLHANSRQLVPAVGLLGAACGLAAAIWQGFGIWRDAQPDSRAQIMSPAHHDAEARTRRNALWGRIGSTVGLAAGSFLIALVFAGDALELLR